MFYFDEITIPFLFWYQEVTGGIENFGQEGYEHGALPPSSLADLISEGWHHCLHKSSLKFAGHAQKEILYCIL